MNKEGNCPLTIRINRNYSREAVVTLYGGDRLGLLSQIPSEEARLIVTSRPYGTGKGYERRPAFELHLEA